MTALTRTFTDTLDNPTKDVPTIGSTPAPALSRTATAPTNRALSPESTAPRDTWTPTRASGIGAAGEPVYDNASLERVSSKPAGQPTAAAGSGSTMGVTAPAVPRTNAPALTRGSQVASTFGQSVLTMPDDNASRPLLSRPTDTGGKTLPTGGAYRGADAMAEHYNASADREARQKLASDLDSQRFRLEMIAGNPGRRGRAAIEALGENAQQQAALAVGAERLAAETQQGRANRANVLANTGLEQAGADRRAELAATGADADRTQQLDIAKMDDATRRAGQDKAETLTGADGRIWRVGADGTARPVADADGKQIAGAQPRDPTALTQGQVLDSLGSELKAATDQLTAMQGINGTSTPEQLQAQQAYVQNLQQQIAGARGGQQGGGDQVAAGAGQQPRAKPSWEQFQARAKAQGSRMTPEQLRAYFDQMQ